jgi:hypothetical protein
VGKKVHNGKFAFPSREKYLATHQDTERVEPHLIAGIAVVTPYWFEYIFLYELCDCPLPSKANLSGEVLRELTECFKDIPATIFVLPSSTLLSCPSLAIPPCRAPSHPRTVLCPHPSHKTTIHPLNFQRALVLFLQAVCATLQSPLSRSLPCMPILILLLHGGARGKALPL